MEAGTFYHVYNHANGSENLFRSDENYRYFLQQWTKYTSPIADTYAYCLMPNHLHFLILTKDDREIRNHQGFENLDGLPIEKVISQQFSNLFNSYAKAFNSMYGRRGSLFMPNYKRKEINSDDYLTTIILYIHSNPVHHGFVDRLQDWQWSSYPTLVDGTPTVICRKEVLDWFGGIASFYAAHGQSSPKP